MKSVAEGEALRAEWTEKSLREAVGRYADAYLRWYSIGNEREAAEALEAEGALHFILSEYRPAINAYQLAATIRRALKDELGVIGDLNSIGYTHIYLGQNRQALSYLDPAMSRLRELRQYGGDPERSSKEAQLLNSLGEAYYSLSEVKKALDAFEHSLRLWLAVGDRRGEAVARLNIGYMYYDFGDLKGASEQYEQSLLLWRALGDKRGEALSLTAKGGVHSFLGEQQTALSLHGEALNTFRSIGDRYGEAVTLNGIGTAYEGLNRPQEAIDNYEEAMRLYSTIGNQDFEALAKFYIGAVFRATGQTARAVELYNQSLALLKEVGDLRLETYVLRDLATVNGSSGQVDAALKKYETVLNLYKRFEDKRGRANTLSSIGDTYYSSGQVRKAQDFHEQALTLFQTAQDRGAEISTQYKLALDERALGDVGRALSRMDDSTKLIEGMRVKAGSPDLRATYFAAVRQHYQLYVDLLMDMQKRQPADGYASEALYVSERSRARAFLDMLAEAKVDIRRGAASTLVEKADTLEHALDARAEFQTRVLSGRHTGADAEEVGKEIRGLSAEYDEIQSQIREQSLLYVTLTQPKLLRLEDIQAELKDTNTLLLEYALGDERSYLWAITADSFTSYELPGKKIIEDEAEDVYRSISARQHVNGETQAKYEERVAEADDKFWPSALALSKTLLGPVADRLGAQRLVIVAEGALQLVPFEALPVISSRRGEIESYFINDSHLPENSVTLVAEHEVSYLQSASMLLALRQEKRPPESERKGIAILADPVFRKDDSRVDKGADPGGLNPAPPPQGSQEGEQSEDLNLPRLPSTREEAKVISGYAPWGAATVITDFDANKTAVVKGEFNKYKILHFATHGVVNNEQPELTCVALSLVDQKGNSQGGFLRVPDLYKLNLSADLVVLSACRTALGKHVGGEGFVGLTRGFMYAGSRSVLASLWKADDEATAELMGHFYHAMLGEGLPPGAALQKAKQLMQSDPKWKHPFFWAAFTLQGEYREKVKVNSPWAAYALIVVPFAAASFALFVYLRRSGRRRKTRNN
jgi:CHAT domain-containing protein